MEIDQLVERLTADATPVRPLAPPVARLALWLIISLPAVGAFAWWNGFRPDLSTRLAEPTFLAEQAAALLSVLVAGYGALCAGLPDEPDWKLWAPWAALGLWIATLGRQCWHAWTAFGLAGLALQQDAVCIPAVTMGALVPAGVIIALLRRGTVVRIGQACLLGSFAAAALADVALRLYHPGKTAMTVIVWQMGSVALFSGIMARFARFVVGSGAVRHFLQFRP